MTATVDVMIPAYGDGPLIREAIQSVLAQKDPRWRLTVIDDAAATESGALSAYLTGRNDPRISYLANPMRLGINRNFQRCADESTAEWVIVLGADDRLLPDCIGRISRLSPSIPDVAWIHTGARIIDDRGRAHLPLADRVKKFTSPKVNGQRAMAGEKLSASLLNANWMYFPSCAFRRKSLQQHGFREGLDIVLDLDLYLRILLDGGSCLLLQQPGIEYRRHSVSLSSTAADDGSRFAEEARYFARVAEVMTGTGWRRAARAARWHLTSRLYAAAKLPLLIGWRNWRDAAALLRVVLWWPPAAHPQEVRLPPDRN